MLWTQRNPIITNSHSIYCGNESSKIRMGNSFPPYLCRRQHLLAAASDTRTEQKKPINRFFTTMMNTAVRRVVSNASRRANATRREFSALFVGTEEFPGYVFDLNDGRRLTLWIASVVCRARTCEKFRELTFCICPLLFER